MLSLDVFTGTYANPGYGFFTLCSPSSMSSYCAKVQSDFAIVDGVQGSPNPYLDLPMKWPRVCSSHMHMRHKLGSTFEMYFMSLYPFGYGKDTTPFETKVIGVMAEFVIEDGQVMGFGISGLIGRLTERARTYECVQD